MREEEGDLRGGVDVFVRYVYLCAEYLRCLCQFILMLVRYLPLPTYLPCLPSIHPSIHSIISDAIFDTKKKKTNPLPPIENMTEERKKENLDFLKETFLPHVRSFQLGGTFYVKGIYPTYVGYIPGCVGVVVVVVGVFLFVYKVSSLK